MSLDKDVLELLKQSEIPNLMRAICCGNCKHGDQSWDNGAFAYCEKYNEENLSTQKCDSYEENK